jgi:hypothetical protein
VARAIETRLRSEALYIIGLGFLVNFRKSLRLRLRIRSAPRLLSCRALEQCLTLEVIHVSTPAWNMTVGVIGKQGAT